MPDKTDPWIVGQGVRDEAEYLVHQGEPLFLCRFAEHGEEPDESLSGLSYSGRAFLFWGFRFFGPQPDMTGFRALMRQGEAAVELFCEEVDHE